MLGQTATFISAPRSEALRNARSAAPAAPRANRRPIAAAVSGNRSWHQLTSRAPVRRAASQARTEIRGGIGLGEDHVARPGAGQQGQERAGGEGRAVERAPRQREAAEPGVAQAAHLDAGAPGARGQNGAGVEVAVAAGEHGDREAPRVERVDQIGEQLAGRAGVGMRRSGSRPAAAGAPASLARACSQLEPVELLAEDHHPQGAADDAQVDPGAGVAHVPGVERDLLLDAQPLAAVHLGPAGDAGADRDALGDPVRQVARPAADAGR